VDGSDIIERLKKRDENVLSDIKCKYEKTCYGIAYGILQNREDAEETVADAFYSVWESIPPAQPPSFEAYLYKAVRNKAMSRLRRQNSDKRSANTVPFDEMEDYLPAEWSVDKAVDEGAVAAAIDSFLDSLPVLSRHVFVCRYFSAMEIKEISNKFGVSQGKVRTMLDNARKELKEKLKREGYNYE
jgi:RNA polymerase sigma-70 factor (ECF subfamily)